MLSKTHKNSTAKGPVPCETNSEATASCPRRHRVRQLRLTSSLLNRLANSNPIGSTTPHIPSTSSPLKLIDITKNLSTLPDPHSPSSLLPHPDTATLPTPSQPSSMASSSSITIQPRLQNKPSTSILLPEANSSIRTSDLVLSPNSLLPNSPPVSPSPLEISPPVILLSDLSHSLAAA